jgi:sigma-B regulation protein RsbU (phosphoserine phosphatase)
LRGALRASADACVGSPAAPDRGAGTGSGTRSGLVELFARLNRHMCRETTTREFATLAMLVVAPDGRSAEYCSAGHEPPLLLRRGQLTHIEEGNLVLGVDAHAPYEQSRLTFEAGDFLLLYTDGAIDALNFAGERFGRERLDAALHQYGTLAPEPALRNIVWDIRRFVGLAEQADDLTVVGVQFR